MLLLCLKKLAHRSHLNAGKKPHAALNEWVGSLQAPLHEAEELEQMTAEPLSSHFALQV